MTTTGEALIALLETYGVDTVFGIPGVHTIELYRGLARSKIRHITPRHEQGAGFMADGYARVTGKPGVAFVITGPGLTNIITAMAQARADSIPMLVISGVNRRDTLGKGLGYLHELPDQRGMMEKVALSSERVERAGELPARNGPRFHVVVVRPARTGAYRNPDRRDGPAGAAMLPSRSIAPTAASPEPRGDRAAAQSSPPPRKTPADPGRRRRQTRRSPAAPARRTARRAGRHHGQCARPAARPSARRACQPEPQVRARTDGRGRFRHRRRHRIRPDRLRHVCRRRLCAASQPRPHRHRRRAARALAGDRRNQGGCARRARSFAGRACRRKRREVAPPAPPPRATPPGRRSARPCGTRSRSSKRSATRCPGSIIVGDSTQPVYAGNLYYDHDRPGGWFNAATGFGALGYGPPAAIGAALADPRRAVVCLSGDGGFQFTLSRDGCCASSRRAGHLRRLEQPRLPRDRDLDAARPASSRSASRRRRRISAASPTPTTCRPSG